ncbi:hypothetical protein [Pseudomonas sp. Sample_21]|uniref:hypothetical protein n=1 Tax=Pseudomonas sp. Sample_21 TaxID=2448265 RepID=UPI0010305DE9|nr:hypothetical protein [Pseudomonas sp. Sample_21]
MPSEDEDLVSKLSARLSEQIQHLPTDGKDHQLTIKIKGNRGHIHPGHPSLDSHPPKHPPPPSECAQPTHCINCDQLAAQQTALIRQYHHNRRLLKTGIACISIAAITFSMKDHLPEALKTYALIATGAFGCLALMLVAAE